MIAKGNAKAGGAEQEKKQSHLEPIDAEIPEVDRNRGDSENESSDKERAGCPVKAMKRNARKHDAVLITRNQRARTTSFLVQL